MFLNASQNAVLRIESFCSVSGRLFSDDILHLLEVGWEFMPMA
jgi:hypothetical protein